MNIFAISDLHLYFSVGPEKTMDYFGDTWVNHTEKLKENWLKQISEDDVVIMPGDFSWAMKLEETEKDFEYLNSLPGKKILVRGNHDLWWSSLKKMQTLYPELTFLQNDSVVIGNIAIMGSRGWIGPSDKDFSEETDRAVYERERMRLQMSFDSLKGQKYDKLICATHFPPKDFTDLLKLFNVNHAIYGHLHGETAFSSAQEGLIDGIEYRLVSYDKLKGIPQLICRV